MAERKKKATWTKDIHRDARRYRRLQILGCKVDLGFEQTVLLRFTNLDEVLDRDLEIHPSRGEAKPLGPTD